MTAPTPTEIRAWRERLGMTQQACADAVGVELSTWNRWELDKAPAPPMLRYAMAWIGLHGPLAP